MNILHYPEMQAVTAELNGTAVRPVFDTYWVAGNEKPLNPTIEQYIRLSSLPRSGVLRFRVLFVGSRLGNNLSLFGVLLLLLLGLKAARDGKAARLPVRR